MRRQHSDDQKANALAALEANGGNLKRTAEQLGLPLSTLYGWSNGEGVHPDVAEIRNQKKGDLADRLEEVAHQLVDVMPGKLDEAPLREVAVALGIAVEKMRLLRGQATSLAGKADELTDEELERKIAELDRAIAEAEVREAGPSPTPARKPGTAEP